MVQKKKLRKSSSVRRKSPSASPGKRRLGDASLDWIRDKTEDEEISSEQAEISKNKSAGKPKETKIGILKQYVFARAKKKEDETPEIPSVISGTSSTIIKGKRETPAKEEEAQKAEIIEIGEEETSTEKEPPSVPDDSAEVAGEKKGDIPPEYEVKKVDVTTKEEISEKPPVYIGLKNLHQLWKIRRRASQEGKISMEDRIPSKKKKTIELVAEEETPSFVKRKRIKITTTGKSLKKGGQKVYRTIAKPFKSDKTKVRKSIISIISVSKQPVKAVSAADRKINQSMRVLLSDLVKVDKTLLKNIKSTDAKITKSAKKLLGSILD